MGVEITGINRGGRGRKSENPSYCNDSTERDMADEMGKIDGSARLLAATMLCFDRYAVQWRCTAQQAMRIVEGMQRASVEEYRSGKAG
jgi:hypothetical protein